MDKRISGVHKWQPYATSTPIKPALDFIKKKNINDNEKLNPSGVLINVILKNYQQDINVPQRKSNSKQKIKKNKASSYFEVTLSSDDESVENKKLELKIKPANKKMKITEKVEELLKNSSTKQEKRKNESKIANNVPREESIEKPAVKNNFTGCHNSTKSFIVLPSGTEALSAEVKTSSSDNVKSRRKQKQQCNKESRNEHSNLPEKNVQHENKIEKCIVNRTNFSANNKSKIPKSTLKKYIIKEQIFTEKEIQFNKNTKAQVSVKKSRINKLTDNKDEDFLRTKKIKKAKDKIKDNKEKFQNVSNDSIFHVDDNKNLSHQLFSNNKELELINSLNLTNVNNNDSKNSSLNENSSEKVLQGNDNFVDKIKNSVDFTEEIKTTIKRISREDSKDNLKEIKSKKLDLSSLKTKNKSVKNTIGKKMGNSKEMLNKNFKHFCESDLNPHGKENENVIPNNEITKSCITEEDCPTKDIICVPVSNEKNTVIQSIQDGNLIKNKKKSTLHSSNPEVFMQAQKLQHHVLRSGCSVAECWSLKNFKCGVLQLEAQSSYCSRTIHSNGYFGGVVTKGSLLMKIGSKEMTVNEGDLSFVPPLTDWSLTNVNDTVANMYYWCGTFKK